MKLMIEPIIQPIIQPMMQPMQHPMMMPCPNTKHPCHMMINKMGMQQPLMYPHEDWCKNDESSDDSHDD